MDDDVVVGLVNNNNNNNGSSYIAHFTNVPMRFTISGERFWLHINE
jgi:hypothetical protein